MYVVFQTSLNPESRSALLGAEVTEILAKMGCRTRLVDLRREVLPIYDGHSDSPQMKELADLVRSADGVIFASPIHSWSVAASTKNFVDHLGSALRSKVVGFLCASGGPRAFLAPLSLMNSVMVDHSSFIVPKHLVIDGEGFTEAGACAPQTIERLNEFAKLFHWMCGRLQPTFTLEQQSSE